jgi:catechol 2,3-dioxygenase
MATQSPIWPAQLDHLRLDSDDPAGLAAFYGRALGYAATGLADGTILLRARERRLVIGPGERGRRAYHAWRLRDEGQLRAVRAFLEAQGVPIEPSPAALFRDDAVAVRDPDGWLSVFGLPRPDVPAPEGGDGPAAALPGRLQHVVVASAKLDAMMGFYERALGFVPSDYVLRDEADRDSRQVAFYRTDPEHHSFAVFGASTARPDHHAYETSGWTDIRDWADHLSGLRIKLFWGPGRHGPGNNLFIMFRDPQGEAVELSAELEHMEREAAPRWWPHDERSLNLWGPGWIRE